MNNITIFSNNSEFMEDYQITIENIIFDEELEFKDEKFNIIFEEIGFIVKQHEIVRKKIMLRFLETIEMYFNKQNDLEHYQVFSEYCSLFQKKDEEKFLDVAVKTNEKEFPFIKRKIDRLLHNMNDLVGLEEANYLMKQFQLEKLINDNHGDGLSCAGYRPIHYAARAGNTKAIEVLAKNPNINMEAGNFGGWTPLFTAIYRLSSQPKKVEETVRALLVAGANPNAIAKRYTPLTYVIKHLKNNAKPTLELLIQNGANRFAKDGYGNTPLVQAKYYKLDKSIQLLFTPPK